MGSIVHVLMFVCVSGTQLFADTLVFETKERCELSRKAAEKELGMVCKQWEAVCLSKDVISGGEQKKESREDKVKRLIEFGV